MGFKDSVATSNIPSNRQHVPNSRIRKGPVGRANRRDAFQGVVPPRTPPAGAGTPAVKVKDRTASHDSLFRLGARGSPPSPSGTRPGTGRGRQSPDDGDTSFPNRPISGRSFRSEENLDDAPLHAWGASSPVGGSRESPLKQLQQRRAFSAKPAGRGASPGEESTSTPARPATASNSHLAYQVVRTSTPTMHHGYAVDGLAGKGLSSSTPDYYSGDSIGLRPSRPASRIEPPPKPPAQPVLGMREETPPIGPPNRVPMSVSDARRQLESKLQQRGISGNQVARFFDRDKRGVVTRGAFREGLGKLHVAASTEAADALFDALDIKGDGQLDNAELSKVSGHPQVRLRYSGVRPLTATPIPQRPPPSVTPIAGDNALVGKALHAATPTGYRRPASAAVCGSANASCPPTNRERAAVYHKIVKEKIYQRAPNERKSFNFFDKDRDGRITATEFERGLENLNLGTTSDEAALIMQEVRATAGEGPELAEAAAAASRPCSASLIALAGGVPGEHIGGTRKEDEKPVVTEIRRPKTPAEEKEREAGLPYETFCASFHGTHHAEENMMAGAEIEQGKLTPAEAYNKTSVGGALPYFRAPADEKVSYLRPASGAGLMPYWGDTRSSDDKVQQQQRAVLSARNHNNNNRNPIPAGVLRRAVKEQRDVKGRVTWAPTFVRQGLTIAPFESPCNSY